MSKSNLDLIKECDNFPYYSDSAELFNKTMSEYYLFKVADCDAVLGYVPSKIVERMPMTELWNIELETKTLVLQATAHDLASFQTRNLHLADYLQKVRGQKIFGVLDGWRNELYPIYGPGKKHLLNMERSATPLFGIMSYGVHMTGYVRSEQGLKVWTPRRAPTKQTYPGMMDNTVAGGLSTGERPFACLIREAQEEASLPKAVVQKAHSCGIITYFYVRDERAGGETGLCQPECQYVYDLEIPEGVIPKPEDGEAIDFRLLTVPELQNALAAGEFKPNCALLLLDFFIRHGILTPENEPDYIEIAARLHRKVEFPMA